MSYSAGIGIVGSSQSNKERHGDRSVKSMPQITPSHTESDSEEAPQEGRDSQSMIALSISPIKPQYH